MNSDTKLFFAYIRVSTLKQGMHGSSLQEQRGAIEAYAQRNGIEIAEWFEERVTAAKRGRSVFARMMRALARGRAKGVIIHKIDRSARNLRDWADLADLIDKGAEVHFAHDALDLRSRGGRLSADIQAVVAADFIRNLREETRKGFYGRLRQGLYPLGAPTGYLDTGRGRTKMIDPVAGPLVRQAFELYASGEYGLAELRLEMSRRGLRSKFQRPLSLHGMSNVLNNPFYTGLIHIRKTNELFEGQHTPLITKQLYDRVQACLHGRRVGRTNTHQFLFRRMIRCAGCNGSLIGERQKGRYVYYRCHGAACAGVSLSEAHVGCAFSDVFADLQFDPVELVDLRDLAEHHAGTAMAEREEGERSLKLLLAQCEERITRITDALLDGLLDKESFETRKAKLLCEKRGYADQLAGIASSRPLAERVWENVELARMAYLSFEKGNDEEKRDLLISLMSNSSANGKNLENKLYSPFQEYLEWRKMPRCDQQRRTYRTRAKEIFDIFYNYERHKGLPESPSSPQVHGGDSHANMGGFRKPV